MTRHSEHRRSQTVFDAKRLIGRKVSDAEVQSDMKHWPFKVIAKSGDKPVVQVEYRGETKEFTPEEASCNSFASACDKLRVSSRRFLPWSCSR